MARSTMTALIARVRLLTGDTSDAPIFTDDQVQDVLDESREDIYNGVLDPRATFSGASILFLDYFSKLGGWEDDYVLKQYLTRAVTPSFVEPIAGHFQFAASTLPPIVITGKLYDVYRGAADLLERQSTQWMLRYSMTVDGQNLQRGMVVGNMQKIITNLRMKQRAKTIYARRSDIRRPTGWSGVSLGPTPIDYMGSGNANGS